MQHFKTKFIIILLISVSFHFNSLYAQKDINAEQIKEQIKAYKNDSRGPYYRIKWFCNDGTVRAAKDPCPEGIGGIQHASLKPEVEKLAKDHHIFLGNLLSANDYDAFWDAPNNHSQLK